MILQEIGDILGKRTIDLDGAPSLEVTIGVPKPVPDQVDEYVCPYRIAGIGSGKIRYAIGMDPIQALQLTLLKIGADLYASPEARAGRLSWDGQARPGDLGFPVQDSLKDLLSQPA